VRVLADLQIALGAVRVASILILVCGCLVVAKSRTAKAKSVSSLPFSPYTSRMEPVDSSFVMVDHALPPSQAQVESLNDFFPFLTKPSTFIYADQAVLDSIYDKRRAAPDGRLFADELLGLAGLDGQLFLSFPFRSTSQLILSTCTAHRSFGLPSNLTQCAANYPSRRFILDLPFIAQHYLDSLLPRIGLLLLDRSSRFRSIPITPTRVCSLDQGFSRPRLGRLSSRNSSFERSENPSTRFCFEDHQHPCDWTESRGTTQAGAGLLEVNGITTE